MTRTADIHGRYLFAPDALTNASPYIDRVEIECEAAALPHIPYRYAPQFLAELGSGSLFASPFGGSCSVQKGRHLVAGNVRPKRPAENASGMRLKLFLSLNPTRFLQAHHVPNSLADRQAMEADPLEALRIGFRTGSALGDASDQTLDAQTNFLAHEPLSYGRVGNWDIRLCEYIDLVLAGIENEIDRVSQRLVGRTPRVHLRNAEWHLKQIEYYWEFRTPDAIQKIASVATTVRRLLRDGYEADFPPKVGSERNAPYVSGSMDHADIRAKLYAKSAQVVRFEVAYDRTPFDALRQRPALARRGDIDHVVQLAGLVSEDAQLRAQRFWAHFWLRHDRPGVASPDRLIALMAAISAASDGTRMDSSALLSLLLHNDGGEPLEAGRNANDPVKRLFRQRVLRRTAGSSSRRARYEVGPWFRATLAGLREMFTTVDAEESELFPDEDPTAGRVRMRRARLEEPSEPPPPPRTPRRRAREGL